MNITFVTGNKNKFDEASKIIPELTQLDIDLPEIQEINPQKVIEEKLKSVPSKEGYFLVEDNSLVLEGMNGLPGPLIKWFLKSVGNEGLVKMASVFGSKAKAIVTIGLISQNGEINYFEGVVEGKIVPPMGEQGFGWDAVFQPDNSQLTFGEMTMEEKNKFSMRAIAFLKVKEFLKLYLI